MPDKISVLLVDDHSLVRRGFRKMLEDEPGIEVIGEAGDGAEGCRSRRANCNRKWWSWISRSPA